MEALKTARGRLRETTRVLELVLVTVGAFGSSRAMATISLEWRPGDQAVMIGHIVDIGLFAVADSTPNQSLSAVDLIFTWAPGSLELLGVDSTGAASLLFSGFPAVDGHGLNEAVPPADGDGFYQAWAMLGTPLEVTPAGTLLTTFQFLALSRTPSTTVEMVPSRGSPIGHTVVWDGDIPGLDVTGSLDTAIVRIPEPSSLILCLVLASAFSAGRR